MDSGNNVTSFTWKWDLALRFLLNWASLSSPCIFPFINNSQAVMSALPGCNCDDEFCPTEGHFVFSTKWLSNVPGYLPLLHSSTDSWGHLPPGMVMERSRPWVPSQCVGYEMPLPASFWPVMDPCLRVLPVAPFHHSGPRTCHGLYC